MLCKGFLILVAFSAGLQRLGRGEAALPGWQLISATNYLCPNLRGRYCCCLRQKAGCSFKHLNLIPFSSPQRDAHLRNHNKHMNFTISFLRWLWLCCGRDVEVICLLIYIFVPLIVHLVHIFFGRFFCYNYMIA